MAVTIRPIEEGQTGKQVADNIKANFEDVINEMVGQKTAEGGEIFNAAASAGVNAHAEGLLTNALGNSSHAEGNSTKSKGLAAHAEGSKTYAFGTMSHTEGESSNVVSDETLAKTNDDIIADWNVKKFSLAKGNSSHVEGKDCLALEAVSHAEGTNNKSTNGSAHSEGYGTESSGVASHSEGNGTKAVGRSSHAEGIGAQSLNEAAHAEGKETIASAKYSHTEGNGTQAKGICSSASGAATIAVNFAEQVGGRLNTDESGNSSPDAFDVSKTGFAIGNGTSEGARGDAFKIIFDGNVKADGTYTSPAADYAEMFEWADGNKSGEDRVGYLVDIVGEKIVKANGGYCIGVVSANPAILGDNAMRWHNKYALDEWGRPITIEQERKEIETHIEYRDKVVQEERIEYIDKVDADGNPYTEEKKVLVDVTIQEPFEVSEEKTYIDKVYKLNPEWNSEQEYTERKDRPEWSAIGMLGKLLVRQDGTLKVGSRCAAKNGIATDDKNGQMYVMRVVNKGQALVLLK